MDTLKDYIETHLDALLAEDIGKGDITTLACLNKNEATARISARSDGVLAGLPLAEAVFKRLDPNISVEPEIIDSDTFESGDTIASLRGVNHAILTGERLALNLMGHLSGVASLTALYVERIKGTDAVILDTRKTTPGLRMLEKYAVKCGGGENHRFGLYDMILIKDNHIAAAGSIAGAVIKARKYLDGSEIKNKFGFTNEEIERIIIEVEVESDTQLADAVEAGIKRILLDNRTPDQLREMVRTARSLADDLKLEASGGITLENVRDFAETGVDYISIGALTHSAKSSDFSLNIV